MMFRLALAQAPAVDVALDESTEEETDDVLKEAKAERARERGPIGTDWEQDEH